VGRSLSWPEQRPESNGRAVTMYVPGPARCLLRAASFQIRDMGFARRLMSEGSPHPSQGRARTSTRHVCPSFARRRPFEGMWCPSFACALSSLVRPRPCFVCRRGIQRKRSVREGCARPFEGNRAASEGGGRPLEGIRRPSFAGAICSLVRPRPCFVRRRGIVGNRAASEGCARPNGQKAFSPQPMPPLVDVRRVPSVAIHRATSRCESAPSLRSSLRP
jgi:hypothetical protein